MSSGEVAFSSSEQAELDPAICYCERSELVFGENGTVVLLTSQSGTVVREMDDFEVQTENRSRHPELAAVSLLCILSMAALTTYGSTTGLSLTYLNSLVFGLSSVSILFLGICTHGCYREAVQNDEVGSKQNGLPLPNHITGLGGAVALFLVALVTTIFAVGQWRPYGFDLPESVGNGTIVALAAIFVLVFLSSRIPIPHSMDDAMYSLRRWTNGVSGLGAILSRIDAVLVFGVAPLGGVTLNNPILRYGCLFGELFAAGILTWFCPAPFGLLGAFWVFILVFGVVRRWGWIEHLRLAKHQDPDTTDSRKIKQIVDLRDEAMTSLLFLVLVVPLAMRQVHLIVPSTLGFRIENNAINDIFSWTGFFGVELLKALPFLDWADIYGANNSAKIHTQGAVSMHSVFVARMIIDLVFLAALVQWISISVAIEKNKRDFLSKRNGVQSLDDRIARNHLKRLVQKDETGKFIPKESISLYKDYDRLALARLKIRYKGDDRLAAAIREIGDLSGKEITSPSEELLEETFRSPPKSKRLNEILSAIEQEGDFDLDNLLPARKQLNWKGGLESERKRLVQLLVRHVPPSLERDKQFAEILSGESADSLRDVRRLVIDTLVRNAKRNPEVISYLRTAARNDGSNAVVRHLRRTMRRFGLTADESNDSRSAA